MVFCRFLLLSVFLVANAVAGIAQSASWKLTNGKATVERKLILPEKSKLEIYKDVYRWLMVVFINPEDILKARLEGEYLRGVGYYPECVKLGSMLGADLYYTFAVEIRNEEVSITFFHAYLLLSYSHEGEGPHPVENYFVEGSDNERRKREENEIVRVSLDAFAKGIVESFEKYVMVK